MPPIARPPRPGPRRARSLSIGRQPVAVGVFRQRRQQRARVGALRRLEQRQHVGLLHLAALVLDDDAVGGLGHHAHIVGDHDQAHAVFGLQRTSRSRICFWMVTSSAVVGSSAISSFGLQAMAMAIMTRWHWPPDIWCGKDVSRSAGSAMPTCFNSSMARARRLAGPCRMEAQHLLDLETDGEAGIEAGHRLLEDHRHVLADDLAPLGRAQFQEIACRQSSSCQP